MGAISYEEFVRQIEGASFEIQPVMAVVGDESFLRQDAMGMLKEELAARGLEIERFDDEERNEEQLVGVLRSGALFGGGTALILNSQRVGQRRESIIRFKDKLLEYFERPSKTNVLLINGATWSGNLAVPRRVKKDFVVIECPSYKPWQSAEIERMITMLAKRHGLGLKPGVAGELREICGGELGPAARELEKLALVVEGRPVSSDDLREHLRWRGDDVSFALCDAILFNDKREAISLAGSFVGEKDSSRYLMFMGLLESNLRKLSLLREGLDGGATDQTALTKSGFNPRHPKRSAYIQAAKSLPSGGVAKIYRVLLEADFAAKGAMADIGTAFVTLAGRLCDERLRGRA